LACACARASIALLLDGDWRANIARIECALATGLAPCRALPGVVDVRTLGAIGVVELATPIDLRMAAPAFVARGVWVRPFGRLVYVMPPYVISDAEIAALTSAIAEVVMLHAGDAA
ncbi:MAG: aminotransferase class III-fold pyridoxal phosphate-dependent enzyme, partial [Gammaproteobacteria bacterium]